MIYTYEGVSLANHINDVEKNMATQNMQKKQYNLIH